ncbi:hypothetical protein CapIbe_007520 [Capra ibex]
MSPVDSLLESSGSALMLTNTPGRGTGGRGTEGLGDSSSDSKTLANGLGLCPVGTSHSSHLPGSYPQWLMQSENRHRSPFRRKAITSTPTFLTDKGTE